MSSLVADRLLRLQDRLERDVETGLIPGVTVVLGNRDRLLSEFSVGYRDADLRDTLRSDAIWRIYSMTKPLITVAAMILVQDGALRLNQPVADFIPAFARLNVAISDQETVPAQSQVTIQDLMRHTSGMAYGYRGDSPAHRALVADGFRGEDLPLASFVDRLAALPLEYEPGTVWHYSHATDVLARVLEVITGKAIDGALSELLFDPLAMTETQFHLPATKGGRVAQPLGQNEGAKPKFYDPCVKRRLLSGGGGLTSTAANYSRFLRMLIGNGCLDERRILSPATVSLMTSDHLGSAISRGPLYIPGPGYGFGLGFAVRMVGGEAAYPGSRGDYYWSGVGGTYFWVDPALEFFALVLLQSSSIEQRLHYRTMVRNMVYAAVAD